MTSIARRDSHTKQPESSANGTFSTGVEAMQRLYLEDMKNHVQPSKAQLDMLLTSYQQGHMAQCRKIAEQLTRHSPRHALAWKILGVLYQQDQHMEEAEFALQKAVELAPKDAEAYYNLGNFYYDQQALKQAERAYQKAVKLVPNFVQAIFNLACVLKDAGEYAQAETHFRKALKLENGHAAMHAQLAEVLVKLGRHKEAVSTFKKALSIKADDADTRLKLAVAYLTLERLEEAQAELETLLQQDEQNASAYNALGLVMQAQHQYLRAEENFKQAIALRPDYIPPYKNLGLLYKDMEKPLEAEACYRKALSMERHPSAETLNNLAVVLMHQGRYPEAESLCREVLQIAPEKGETWNNLGLIMETMIRRDEAVEAFKKALQYQPKDVNTLVNYSVTLKANGHLSEAERYLKLALKQNPDDVKAYINLAMVQLDQANISAAISHTQHALSLAPDNLIAHDNLLYAMTYDLACKPDMQMEAAKNYGKTLSENTDKLWQQWAVNSSPAKLRIGLVSGDFRQHPVGYFLKNVLQHMARGNVELIGYSTDGREDTMTAELKPFFTEWRSLAGYDAFTAAAMIHQDAVHVLLDLSGHTGANKLPLFAYKPAPVQASWLGYWATTGVEGMDYFIADETSVPAEHCGHFTEKVVYLPQTRMCFTPPDVDINVNVLPALSRGYVTFGCFQNLAKVNDDVLRVWAQVMQTVPDSRLRWQCKSFHDQDVVSRVQQRLKACGIDPQRVLCVGKVPRETYFTAYHEVDLILDTFPFTGGTTTCEALWMGVPTLTWAGETLIARQGASIMRAAGLDEWVVESRQQFVERAIAWTNNLSRLAEIRRALRTQIMASPLFDSVTFAQQFEAVLWKLWHAYIEHPSKPQSSKAITEPLQDVNMEDDCVATKSLVIKLISATRMTESDFWQKSALGSSFKQHAQQDQRLAIAVAFENRRGLSTVFNEAIDAADKDDVLVFIHDDVWLDESRLADAVIAGLSTFDVIGVAGNRRCLPDQPSWAFIDTRFTWDAPDHLSGKVAHGQTACGSLSTYGPVPAECALLDGVLLAAKAETLQQTHVRFDSQFQFHFYDLDFCRTARVKKLRLGTWPIAITHQSGGAFGSPAWQESYQHYLKKWNPTSPNLHHQGATAVISPNHDIAQKLAEIRKKIQRSDSVKELEWESLPIQEVFERALLAEESKAFTDAIQAYQHLLHQMPEHSEANYRLGMLFAHDGAFEAALPYLERAISSGGEHEQYWVSYAEVLLQLQAYQTFVEVITTGQQFGLSKAWAEALMQDLIQLLDQYLVDNMVQANQVLQQLLASTIAEVIHVNQASIQSAQRAGQPVDSHLDLRPFQTFAEQYHLLDEPNRMLAIIRTVMINVMGHPALMGHTIYTPYFDQLMSGVKIDTGRVIARKEKQANVVIASEVYDFGGHTKAIIEMLHVLENPILVITDVHRRFYTQPFYQRIASTLPHCPVMVLPAEKDIDKTIRLATFINSYAKNVFLFNHHQDAMAVMACQAHFDVHYFYIHHADHGPALGNHVPHFRHVDLFENRAKQCAQDLKRDTCCLPTTSVDKGLKTFSDGLQHCGTVTAGTANKFYENGKMRLGDWVAEVLRITGGQHFHFGSLSEDEIGIVREAVIHAGCRPEQFIYKGNVPSLWEGLLEIDAHIYIGSAPIMGAKSDIEAQGAGYPLLAFKAKDCPRHMNVGSHAPQTHYWHDIPSLIAGLKAIMADHARFSQYSRAFYEQSCTKDRYQNTLETLVSS